MSDTKVMHKRQLVDEVARRSGPWGLTRKQVCEALHGILDVITDKMAEGNAVTISGFGRYIVFNLRTSWSRPGVVTSRPGHVHASIMVQPWVQRSVPLCGRLASDQRRNPTRLSLAWTSAAVV